MSKDIDAERVSRLKAPIMLLTGHTGEVYTLEFSPNGEFIATGSKDKEILLFEVYGDCINFGVLSGHKNAVLELHWNNRNDTIYSCSADHTAAIWDVEYRKRIKKLSGHSGIVNSCSLARNVMSDKGLLVTGSDDGYVKVWDTRVRRSAQSIFHDFQVLSVSVDPNAERIFAGSLDNIIRVYDLKTLKELFQLKGCLDSITSLDLNHDSMDQRLTIWDIQPFCDGDRAVTTLFGPTHNAEKILIKARWGKDTLLCSGSADHMVYVLDSKDRRILYRLPGHLGSVNDACFHPLEPIIASCSSDKCVYIGELV